MVDVAEDRGAAVGLVGPDALEHACAVVEGVREYVYLRVLPGDELAVHPDEVRGVHVLPPFSEVGEDRLRGVLRSGVAAEVRGTEARLEGCVDGGFYPGGFRLPTESIAQHHGH